VYVCGCVCMCVRVTHSPRAYILYADTLRRPRLAPAAAAAAAAGQSVGATAALPTPIDQASIGAAAPRSQLTLAQVDALKSSARETFAKVCASAPLSLVPHPTVTPPPPRPPTRHPHHHHHEHHRQHSMWHWSVALLTDSNRLVGWLCVVTYVSCADPEIQRQRQQ